MLAAELGSYPFGVQSVALVYVQRFSIVSFGAKFVAEVRGGDFGLETGSEKSAIGKAGAGLLREIVAVVLGYECDCQKMRCCCRIETTGPGQGFCLGCVPAGVGLEEVPLTCDV